VVLGPQGSGKGTQAEYLARRFRVPAISIGDMLRHEVANHTSFGRRYAKWLTSGRLAPDAVVNAILARRLSRPDARRGFVLDGYARTRSQVTFLESKFPGTLAILLTLPDAEAVRRIARRRTSPTCGATYHLDFKPPKKSGRCDVCDDRLIQRTDDTPSVVRRRLRIYHRESEPVVEYFAARARLITVDGSPRIPAVYRSIVKALEGQSHSGRQ
jgi:adenylate kinase